MAIQPKDILKSYFQNGDKPNQTQFSDLIDSFIHVNDNVNTPGGGSNPTNPGNPGGPGNGGGSGGRIMPIPFIDSYDYFYFVSAESGDDEKASPNSYRFYKTIVAASEAAKERYDVSNTTKAIVFVFKGTYNEESVNRNHVDMYFEDGALVWTEGVDSSIINDKIEAITNANVYGKGTFFNKNYDSFDDREAINMRNASSMYIEAKLIDGIQLFRNDPVHFEFANMTILFRIANWHNKSMKFTNCKFPNGLRVSSFRNEGGKHVYENCEFILPKYSTDNILNTSLDIYDYKEELVFRAEYNNSSKDIENPIIQLPPINTTDKSNDAVIKEFYEYHSKEISGKYPEISCILYTQLEPEGYDIGNFKLEFKNSRCTIQKEHCIGVLLSHRKNSETTEGHVLLDNITIVDETESKNTTALVTGWGSLATQQPELMINTLSHNCETDHKLVNPDFNKWEITFNTIGDFVSKKNGGRFNENITISKEIDENTYAGIYLANSGTLATSHKIPTGNGVGGGLYVRSNEKGNVYLDFRAKPKDYKGDQSFQLNYYEDTNLFKKPVHGLQMVQPNSLMVIGGSLGGIGTGDGYKEGDKFRILNGNAEIDGTLRVKGLNSSQSIFENGVRVATQTWVNTAVAGLVAANIKAKDADKLDGIDSIGFAKQEIIPAKTLKIGWYTIAINVGNRASAKFVLKETRSGRHQSIHFYAGHSYGNGNVITVLSNSYHSNEGAIKNLRIKEGGTYDGAVLQAYIDTDDAPVSGFIFENIQSSGWEPRAWILNSEAPKGIKDYSKLTNVATEIDLDKTIGIHSSADIFVQGDKVLREGNDIDITNKELKWRENTDGASIGFKNTDDHDPDSYLYFKTIDNGVEYFKWIHDRIGYGPEEWMQLKGKALKVLGDVHANGTYYWGANKKAIQFSDSWLRLNPTDEFTSGVYCGKKILRTDGEFQVGPDGDKFKVDLEGNTVAAGNITAYSDRRLKEALKPVTENFLEKIDKLKPTFYQWKDKTKSQKEQLGFIAQEVMELFPQWVHKNDEHYSMSYDKMGAVLAVKGIQELHKEIKTLKTQLKALQHGIAN